ncbi:MAG TPA: BatD family protein [Gammaproteobacteria bacterium]|nr:BatD family protein [Gammaproteobacteria bacterium]
MVRPAAFWGIALGALAGLACNPAAAASLVLRASVDRSQPHLNESFMYTLRAEGDASSDPDPAALRKQFDVLQNTMNTRIQIVNGQAEQVSEWVYELMPRKTGHLTIPAMEIDGVYSNPVQLEVQASTAASKAPADIFMEVEAEPMSAYVQSQVVYTMRLFIGIGTGRATVTPPNVTGGEAIVEKLGDDRQYQTTRGGRSFVVHERRYAIFPQHEGKLTVEPTTFEAMVMSDSGFSRIKRFRSGSVDIMVKPAVAPPAQYPKAAWLPARSVKLAEKWSDDLQSLTVGVPLTRTLTIDAEGLLETQLPKLEVPSTDGIRLYPDQPDLDQSATADGLTAQRSERYAVLAQKAGPAQLAAVKLPWFDVETGRWKVAQIPARPVMVIPGAPTAASPGVSPATPAASAPQNNAGSGGASRVWPATTALLALAWLATAALAFKWRKGRVPTEEVPPAEPASGPPARRVASRRLVAELRGACERDDAESARRLLLDWAAVQFPDSPPRSLGAVAKRTSIELAAAIQVLEARLYGRTASGWKGAELAAALAKAAAPTAAGEGRAGGAGDGLMPLYR